jgi:hypothetical protein
VGIVVPDGRDLRHLGEGRVVSSVVLAMGARRKQRVVVMAGGIWVGGLEIFWELVCEEGKYGKMRTGSEPCEKTVRNESRH